MILGYAYDGRSSNYETSLLTVGKLITFLHSQYFLNYKYETGEHLYAQNETLMYAIFHFVSSVS